MEGLSKNIVFTEIVEKAEGIVLYSHHNLGIYTPIDKERKLWKRADLPYHVDLVTIDVGEFIDTMERSTDIEIIKDKATTNKVVEILSKRWKK